MGEVFAVADTKMRARHPCCAIARAMDRISPKSAKRFSDRLMRS